jgi:hypothetical protein
MSEFFGYAAIVAAGGSKFSSRALSRNKFN